MSSRRRSNSDCGREDAMYDAMQERGWQQEEEYETAEEVRQQQEKDEYEESLRVLGMSEEEADAYFAESNQLVDEAIERYQANLEAAIGYTLSPNRAILKEFYPDVQVPIPQWFSLLHEIRQNSLEADFDAEVSAVLDDEESIRTDDNEDEEKVEEDEGPMCQPIFTAPIPLGECPICMDALEMVNITVTKCGHSFHASCLLRSVEDSSDCPMCRRQLTKKRERTNYDDIEWVEYEEEEEGTEVDEDYEEEPTDEEEERRRIPSLDNEPHWDPCPLSPTVQAQRKREEEEFEAFAKTFAGRTSHSIFIQAQDTFGQAHTCFTMSHASRAAGDSWNAHKYQCHFATLIQKGHKLMSLTKRPRPDSNANDHTWQTNRKTTKYLDPSAPAKDFLSAIMKSDKKQEQQPLEIDID